MSAEGDVKVETTPAGVEVTGESRVTNVYRREVGSFDCLVVDDGTFAYPHPPETFFADAPEEELEQALLDRGIDPAGWDEYVSPYPCLVVRTGDYTVLIDTGGGDLAPTTGNLPSNLEKAEIGPEEIDVVLLTHGHPDHIGGCVTREGRPRFPQARYVMSGREWDFWTSDPDLSDLGVGEELKSVLRGVPQEVLPPLGDRIELIEADTETEIVPGIRTLPAPGHTPGHLAVSITSEGDELLHLADTVLHPIHLEHPDWHAGVDHDPPVVTRTRRHLLEQSVVRDAPVFVYHFPFPGLGRVTRSGEDSWEWHES